MGSGGQRPNARRDRAVRVEGERARRVRVGPARTRGVGCDARAGAGGCGRACVEGWAACAGLRGVAGLARVGPRGGRVRGRRVGFG